MFLSSPVSCGRVCLRSGRKVREERAAEEEEETMIEKLKQTVNISPLIITPTCDGQLGLMETLLRLYRAEDTGLKTVIPSLRDDHNRFTQNIVKNILII